MKFNYFLNPVLCLALTFGMVACSDDDDPKDPDESVDYGRNDMWGETLGGTNLNIKAYPDNFAYYWEYTFDNSSHNIGLRITGEFPLARFFNYNVYDDVSQTGLYSVDTNGNKTSLFNIEDADIVPDQGSVNPYATGSQVAGQKYTVYFVPEDASREYLAKDNVCLFASGLERVCVILRCYLPDPAPFSGVEMPTITAFDLTTGEDIELPERAHCGLLDIELPANSLMELPILMFFRAPDSQMYTNGPSEYTVTPGYLREGKVWIFNFMAPSYPSSFSEYASADMRYWSICLGDAETYTHMSLCDYETLVGDDGFATYVVADKGSDNYDTIKSLCAQNGYNLLTWDRASWGDGVMCLYRNMMFASTYAHSMRLCPALDVAAGSFVPSHMVLGDWGAYGLNIDESVFIGAYGMIPIDRSTSLQ